MINRTQQKQKKYGTREEVFLGMALKTTGGLCQNDIIQKKKKNKIIYISRKLSDIAKERDMFTNYRKTKTKTLQPTKMTKKNVSFSLNQNKYHSIYYPELKGKDLNTLRQYNIEDDDNDDEHYLGKNDNNIQHTPKQFRIQDINELQLE